MFIYHCLNLILICLDELVELLIHIVHKIGVRAERKVYKELFADLMRVSGKTTLLFKIAEAADSNPDGTVRDVVFPVVGEQTLRDLVKEYHADGPAYKLRIHKTMRGSYGRHYRQMLPDLLDALDFHTHNSASQPVIEAVKLLRKYIDRAGLTADQLFHGAGCDACRGSGYAGRLGIYELLIVDDMFRDMINKDSSTTNMRRAFCQSGQRSMFEDGMIKVKQGLTTVEEVLRVTEVYGQNENEEFVENVG